MTDFQFKVGDVVITRASIADAMMKCRTGTTAFPRHAVIVERITQECPGGVQRHYVVRMDLDYLRLNEIEVCSPDAFDPLAAITATAQADCQVEAAIRATQTTTQKED